MLTSMQVADLRARMNTEMREPRITLLDLPDELLLQIFSYVAPETLSLTQGRRHLSLALDRRLLGIVRESLFSTAHLTVTMNVSDFFGFCERIEGFEGELCPASGERNLWQPIRDSILGQRLRLMRIVISVYKGPYQALLQRLSDIVKTFPRLCQLDVLVINLRFPSLMFTELLHGLRTSLELVSSQRTRVRIREVESTDYEVD